MSFSIRPWFVAPVLLAFSVAWTIPGCGSGSSDDDEATPTPGTPVVTPTPGDDDATGDDDTVGDDDITEPPAPTLPPNVLDTGNWYVPTHDRIEEFAEMNGGSVGVVNAPVAVVAWEDTAIFGSIAEATFRYQVFNLAFQIEPGLMEEIVPIAAGPTFDSPATVTTLSPEFGEIPIADLQQDILEDYNVLYYQAESLGCTPSDTEEGGAGNRDTCIPLDDLKTTESYKDFVAKFIYLYEGLKAHPDVGPGFTAPMIARLLGGYAEGVVQTMARAAFDAERALPIAVMTITSPNVGVVGSVSATYRQGIRTIPEMEDLFNYLRRAGFDLWVVTSAAQPLVAAVANTVDTGYLVPSERVIGIELELGRGVNPKLTTYLKSGEPVPWGPGKVDAIDQKIGKDPMFVFGATAGDYQMLTAYATQALQVVINHNEGCPINQLYAIVATGDIYRGEYLLQGVDENTGVFRSAQESIALGQSSPTALPTTTDCSG